MTLVYKHPSICSEETRKISNHEVELVLVCFLLTFIFIVNKLLESVIKNVLNLSVHFEKF